MTVEAGFLEDRPHIRFKDKLFRSKGQDTTRGKTIIPVRLRSLWPTGFINGNCS